MVKDQNRIIVALDFASADQATTLAKQLSPDQCRLKVGKELFTYGGPALVIALQRLGFDIFLDLKFHDIPNTCAQAVKAAAELGVWMVNVHGSGGRAMLDAAREALVPYGDARPHLIAVTALTSLETPDLLEIGFAHTAEQLVERLAGLAQDCHLDGVVCSSREATRLRRMLGDDFLLVTPGVRPLGAASNDQKRVMTPAAALAAGSDYLVVGRPITASPSPLAALASIREEISATIA